MSISLLANKPNVSFRCSLQGRERYLLAVVALCWPFDVTTTLHRICCSAAMKST